MSKIDTFMEMLVGTFDNKEQINDEIRSDNIIHPKAKHIIGLCNEKITNLPKDFRGFFVIEESFFDMGDKIIEKNYLFSYEERDKGEIILVSFDLPDDMGKDSLRNSNENFQVDYTELKISPRFQPLALIESDDAFIGENTSAFSNDAVFHFSLKVAPEALYVKELLMRNNERIAGYNEPIIYKKID